MPETRSEAETLVRDLDKLRSEQSKLDSYLRQLRLGRGIEMIRFRFRAGVYGMGWANAKAPEAMPDGMEQEFYAFLSERARSVAALASGTEAALALLTAPDPEEA